MININVVSRISADKDSFGDLLYLLHVLQQDGISTVQVLFIGPIQSQNIYDGIINKAGKLGVSANIAFTKAAIPINKLSDEIKSGYFINFTVGDFAGYSALESVKTGLKTLCYNTDKNYDNAFTGNEISMCANIDELIGLVKRINADKAKMDQEIIACNLKMLEGFALGREEQQDLLSIICPACS
jgi:hypothetical protein